jgi:hypothetical protein
MVHHIYLRVAPRTVAPRPVQAVVAEWRRKLLGQFPGADVDIAPTANLIETRNLLCPPEADTPEESDEARRIIEALLPPS